MPANFSVLPGGLVWHHAVMNLPASALSFVDAFVGAFDPNVWGSRPLPLVHLYTFKPPSETEAGEGHCLPLEQGWPIHEFMNKLKGKKMHTAK
jgi:tRNA (guanine37-N1)-methyltransferase